MTVAAAARPRPAPPLYLVGQDDSRHIARTYRAVPIWVPRARQAVEDHLRMQSFPEAVRYAARMIVSELATNSVVHSASADEGCFTVRVECKPDDYVWIEVEDQGGPWRTKDPASKSPADEEGRGLVIVQAMASEWGIEDVLPLDGLIEDGERPVGRVVWARLDLPPLPLPEIHHEDSPRP